MTTTTIPLRVKPGQEMRIGSKGLEVTAFLITDGEHSFDMFRTPTDEWWEQCDECQWPPLHGVCFTCGGNQIRRVSGTEKAMMMAVRKRIKRMTRPLNAVERIEENAIAQGRRWAEAHPNVASDLARTLATGRTGGNVLVDLALALQRGPLTPKQHAYAVVLLERTAWDEAHASDENGTVYVGKVDERATVTGRVNVAHPIVSPRYGGSTSVLIVIEQRSPEGVAMIKMQTGAAWALEISKGDTVTVTGTVRKHQDTAFGRQTVLTAPKRVG